MANQMPMTISLIFAFIAGGVSVGGLVYLKLKSQILAREVELQTLKTEREQQASLAAQMAQQFELLAGRIVDEKSARLSDQSIKNLAVILEPFKERLREFEKKVEDTYATERSERGSLRGELSRLMELNIKMSGEAENLTRALKGNIQVQGAWGEMILENILERSGLRKGEEYVLQGTDMSLRNTEGQTIKPDVVVNLPEGRHLIVDSKVSLSAYESYLQAETAEEQDKWGRLHIDSLKKHIEGLARKQYHTAEALTSPDFILLFMPLEPAFALAFKLKPDLLQYAWERGIALVSPTTLLTSLRTVAIIWKQERQEKNALEIARRGGALYDKFVGLITDLEGVGKKIDEAQRAHQGVMGKISQGSGNLLRQVEMLRELGAKTEKRLIGVEPIEKNEV